MHCDNRECERSKRKRSETRDVLRPDTFVTPEVGIDDSSHCLMFKIFFPSLNAMRMGQI